jgi:hypothetical protein
MNHFVRHLESKYDASTKPFEEFATDTRFSIAIIPILEN